MKGPAWLEEAIRFTRFKAGKYNHWSSDPAFLVCDKKAVPFTSAGVSKITRERSPWSVPSNVLFLIFRDVVLPYWS